MLVDKKKYEEIIQELKPQNILLVAVSKTKSIDAIKELFALGQRDFGENYVQELVDKVAGLPTDIRWHYIGHLQTNKVKQVAPVVQLIHGVDSLKLLKEIHKQGGKSGRVIDCLVQVHISGEETKFGVDKEELSLILNEFNSGNLLHVRILGLMGMASFTTDMDQVRKEFRYLKELFDKTAAEILQPTTFTILSMGMSGDYKVALEEGSNMVRIGSLIFGERDG